MDGEDLILWPDGEWCFAVDLREYTAKSDDYERIPFGSEKWHNLVDDDGNE